METEIRNLETIKEFESESLIPVEIFSCDTNTKTRLNDIPSIVELGKQLLTSAKDGDTEMVRDLMCRGAPFTTDWLGTSALHMAAHNNNLETAEVLLRAGISRDARTKVDRTPLHMAAYEGHHEMALLLLAYGADIDSRDMLKMTPLHWAVERENIEVIRILLQHGADPNALSKFNKSPITIALEHDRIDLVDMLQQEHEIINLKHDPELEAATHNLLQLEKQNHNDDLHVDHFEEKKSLAANKSQIIYQPISLVSNSDEEEKDDSQTYERNTETIKNIDDSKFSDSKSQSLKILKAHGIKMISMDDSTIVENAMESGQTVVLTEAGKLALNLTNSPAKINFKQIPDNSKVIRKVIKIRADQIVRQNTPLKAPNILKRTYSGDLKGNNKYIFTTLSNSMTENFQKMSPVKKEKSPVSIHDLPVEYSKIQNNFKELEEREIAELSKKLAKTEKEIEKYQRHLEEKLQEAENYRKQLRDLINRKNLK